MQENNDMSTIDYKINNLHNEEIKSIINNVEESMKLLEQYKMEKIASLTKKYENLLENMIYVYNFLKEGREYFEKIDNEDYKQGAINRIDNTVFLINKLMPEVGEKDV
jgi:hypothetical protein